MSFPIKIMLFQVIWLWNAIMINRDGLLSVYLNDSRPVETHSSNIFYNVNLIISLINSLKSFSLNSVFIWAVYINMYCLLISINYLKGRFVSNRFYNFATMTLMWLASITLPSNTYKGYPFLSIPLYNWY